MARSPENSAGTELSEARALPEVAYTRSGIAFDQAETYGAGGMAHTKCTWILSA